MRLMLAAASETFPFDPEEVGCCEGFRVVVVVPSQRLSLCFFLRSTLLWKPRIQLDDS